MKEIAYDFENTNNDSANFYHNILFLFDDDIMRCGVVDVHGDSDVKPNFEIKSICEMTKIKFENASNLIYSNERFYILNSGKIYYMMSNLPLNSNSSFDLWNLPLYLNDIVAFYFVDDLHVAILYNGGKDLVIMHISTKSAMHCMLPTDFIGDYVFSLDASVYTYNIKNSKLYQINDRNIAIYTGLNVTDPIKNGHVAHIAGKPDEFHYFFNGKLKKIRKKVEE